MNRNFKSMWSDTQRLDKMLVERGMVPSRTKAQTLIKQSAVTVNGGVITKPNTRVNFNDVIEITNDPCPWVSRGGLKLDFALRHFNVSVKNLVALDIGASTGGFSQVLLQYGVQKIFAVDVGTDQLHDSLRQDIRIVCMEQTDVRSLTPATLPPVDIIVVDVSFVSLIKILSTPLDMVIDGGQGLFLIKPQFEVGKQHIGKGGIVTDTTAVQTAIDTIETFFTNHRWTVHATITCSTRGGDGNQEYILYATKR